MYPNTPNSASSQRSVQSQASSPATHAPRMGAHGLPYPPTAPASAMSPYASGNYAPFAMPQNAGNHNIAYGLMTPPGSPDKPSRGLDFHPHFDLRGQPLFFDLRQGAPLRRDNMNAPVMNHATSRVILSVGPNVFNVEIAASNGTTPTLLDLVRQLAAALSMPASSTEVASAISTGAATPGSYQRGTTRAQLLSVKSVFAGLTLRSLQHGVAVVDCHLRHSM